MRSCRNSRPSSELHGELAAGRFAEDTLTANISNAGGRALARAAGRRGVEFETREVSSAVERLLYTQDVGGSKPSPPTSYSKRGAPEEMRSAAIGAIP